MGLNQEVCERHRRQQSLRARVDKIDDKIDQLKAQKQEIQSQMPDVAATGIVREGGSSGTNHRVTWVPGTTTGPNPTCDGREFLRCGNVPVRQSLDVDDSVFEDVLPDLRKSGFKGRVIVDTESGELLQYQSPEELHETYYDPDVFATLVDADVDDVIVPIDMDMTDVFTKPGSEEPSFEKTQFATYLDDRGIAFDALLERLAMVIRETVAAINSHYAENIGPLANTDQDVYYTTSNFYNTKPTRVQRAEMSDGDPDTQACYEVRYLDGDGLLTLTDHTVSATDDYQRYSNQAVEDAMSILPEEIADIHPDGEWDKHADLDFPDHVSVPSDPHGNPNRAEILWGRRRSPRGLLPKVIDAFPDGDRNTPTFQFKLL